MTAKAPDSLSIALAQLNPVMGDFPGNLARARAGAAQQQPGDVRTRDQ